MSSGLVRLKCSSDRFGIVFHFAQDLNGKQKASRGAGLSLDGSEPAVGEGSHRAPGEGRRGSFSEGELRPAAGRRVSGAGESMVVCLPLPRASVLCY